MLEKLQEFWEKNKETDFQSKVEEIDGFQIKIIKRKDVGLGIIKAMNPTSFEDVKVYDIKGSIFTKKKINFKSFFYEDNQEDSLVSFSGKDLKKGFENIFNISNEFGVDETMYFIFPMFEKFSKIYPLRPDEKRKEGLNKNSFINYLVAFISLASNHEEDKLITFKKIMSNENLREVFLIRKKNNFLQESIGCLCSKGLYWERRRLFLKKLDIRLFNEIENAMSQNRDEIINAYRFLNKGHLRNKEFFSDLSNETFKDFFSDLSKETFLMKNQKTGDIYLSEGSLNKKNEKFSLFFPSLDETGKTIGTFSIEKIVDIYDELRKVKPRTDFYHVLKYLKKCEEEEFLSIDESVSNYKDYLKMSNDLYKKYDRFPKRLIYSHNKVASIHNKMEKFHDFDEGLKKRHEFLKFLEGEIIDGYSLVIPKTSLDIVNEGKALNHCVSGYIDDMSSNNTTILFVRSSENIEKPLYTIEIKDGMISQFKGHSNSKVPDEVNRKIRKAIYQKIKILSKKGA